MASAGTPYRLVPAHFYPCLLIKEAEGEDGMKRGEEDKGEEWTERGGEEWDRGGREFVLCARKKKEKSAPYDYANRERARCKMRRVYGR